MSYVLVASLIVILTSLILRDYLKEIPGSIERSSIRPLPDWQCSDRVRTAITGQTEKPDTFKLLFGDGARCRHTPTASSDEHRLRGH